MRRFAAALILVLSLTTVSWGASAWWLVTAFCYDCGDPVPGTSFYQIAGPFYDKDACEAMRLIYNKGNNDMGTHHCVRFSE